MERSSLASLGSEEEPTGRRVGIKGSRLSPVTKSRSSAYSRAGRGGRTARVFCRYHSCNLFVLRLVEMGFPQMLLSSLEDKAFLTFGFLLRGMSDCSRA